MKRGISPIISIVIIIGLVVAIAGLVVVWGNDFVRGIISDSSSEANKRLTCATAVDLKMVSSCYQEDEVVFTIESKAETDVKKFLVSLIGDDSETVEVNGLRAFGIDTFSIDANDISDFDFLGLDDIRIVPYIEKEGVEYVCDNYILKDNQISCCVGHCLDQDPGNTCSDNNDCEGVDNYCCTSSDSGPPCNNQVGLCIGCLNDNHCPSDEPYCVANECEECRDINDCGANEICDNNECAQQSSSQVNCGDVSYNIVTHVNGNDDVCKRDSDIYITIDSNVNNVNGFTFRLNGDQGFTQEFTKIGTGTFVFRYGFGTDTIQTNEIINSITVIPTVSAGYESCVNSRTQTVNLGCCQIFATCSELDCGKNPYINGETNDGGIIYDRCDSPSTIKEYYCDVDGARKEQDFLPCGGDLCSVGATECTF